MKQTSNYQLNQWEKTDRILMEDFNGDNAKVDAALKTQTEELAALTAAAGNCEMEVLTYTGTGIYGFEKPTVITFSQKPDIYFIGGDVSLIAGQSETANPIIASRSGSSGGFVSSADVSWSGSQLSLTNGVDARYQMNTKNAVYWVLGLRKKG